MKIRIILLVLISFLCFEKSIGQKYSRNKNDQKQDVIIQKSDRLSDNEIKKPKTERQAVVAVKVLNRHGAKFSYNNSEISYREALKLVRKKFDNLIIIENQKSETITIADKK